MRVPLRPGTELVCNCPAAHHATVSADGTAPALPATCTGSFWARPTGEGTSGRVYGVVVSVGIIPPSSSHCAYRT